MAAARLRLGLQRQAASLTEQAGFGLKERVWNDKALLRLWRERWAEMANERLAELGHDVRIDHRSHAARGLDLEPQNKIGPAGARRAQRGEDAERADEHRAIARRNGERLLA
jgi:ATP-dependent exoDNAse (exonuclease V) alpha subunit